MNPDTPQTPQEQLEARLTALLLGELTPHEAASLHEAIQNDARLGELYSRLKETIVLVRETAASPAGQTAAQPAPLKLSEDRRQKLLAQFKTVAPREFVEARGREKSSLSPLLAAAAVLALMAALAVMLLPALSRAKAKAVSISVRSNLKQVEIAKEMWASDNAKSAGDAVTLDDLKPYLGEDRLRSIAGEKYVPGLVGDPAAAEVDAAHAKKSFGRLPNGQPPGDGREKLVRLSQNGEISFVDKNVAENAITRTARESKVEDLSQKVAVKVPQEPSSPKRAEIFLPPSNELADAAKAPDTKPGFDFSLNSAEQNKLAYAVKSQTDLGADVAEFTNRAMRSDDTWSFDNLNTVQTPALVSGGVAGDANLHFYRDLNGNVGTNAIGDPTWIGLLDHPANKDSGTNQFVARYAFTSDIKPGLDIDLISNQVAPPPPASVPSSVIHPNTGLPIASAEMKPAADSTGQMKAFSIPLANADPKDVKTLLQNLFPGNVGQDQFVVGASGGFGRFDASNGQARSDLSVTVDPDTKSVVVKTYDKTFAQIKELVKQIDKPVQPLATFSVPLTNADPKDVLRVLQDVYPDNNLARNNNTTQNDPLVHRMQTVTQNQLVVKAGSGTGGASGGGGAGGGGIKFMTGGGPVPVAAPAGPEIINGNQAPGGAVLSGGTQPSSVGSDFIDGYSVGKLDQKLTSGLRNDSFGLADKDVLTEGGNAAKSTTHGAANIGKSAELATNRRRAGEEEAGKAPVLAELPTLGRAFKSDSLAAADTSAMVTNGIVLPQVTESEQGKETPPKLRDYVPLQSRSLTVLSPRPPESKAAPVAAGSTTSCHSAIDRRREYNTRSQCRGLRRRQRYRFDVLWRLRTPGK